MRIQPNKSIGESESHRRTAITYREHKLTARHLKPAKQRAKACKPVVAHPKKITLKCLLSVHEVSNDYPHTVKIIRDAPRLRHLAPNGQVNPDIVKEVIKVAQRFKPLNDHLQMNLEDTRYREPETLLPLPPAMPSAQGKPSTLHRRAALAKEGLLPPLSPEEEAQVTQNVARIKEGIGSFIRLRVRSFENQQTEDGFQQGGARVVIDHEAIAKRLTPEGEQLMDRLVEARKPSLKNWEEPPEDYEKD